MKKKISDLSEQERIKTLDALYTAASGVQGRKAMKAFLRDLLTESERIMLGRRIQIARLLLQNETHDAIRERTGAGLQTIERVRFWLQDQIPGYETAIAALEEEFGKREFKRKYAKSMLFRLKRRYPLHFLLFPEPKL
ncbi:MAG: Trp family transcriptional regulator [Candidatus Pacebacteria bacterium]|nr:Trp family transcriptional regulator [Candidatus Paceibacterota bacterium]